MKTMIYTAVGLISCASVFGLSDYLSAKKNGSLVNYENDPVTVVTTETTAKKDDVVVIKENSASPQKTKIKKIAKKKVMHARAEIPMMDVELAPNTKTEVAEAGDVVPDVKEEEIILDIIPESKTKRKINMEMFSRKMPSKEFKKKK